MKFKALAIAFGLLSLALCALPAPRLLAAGPVTIGPTNLTASTTMPTFSTSGCDHVFVTLANISGSVSVVPFANTSGGTVAYTPLGTQTAAGTFSAAIDPATYTSFFVQATLPHVGGTLTLTEGCTLNNPTPPPTPTPTPGPTPTPAPAPTFPPFPWSVACLSVYPCGFPTPIPFPSAFFVTGAFPTPIPFPSAFFVTGAFPTPIPWSTGSPAPVNCVSGCSSPNPTYSFPPYPWQIECLSASYPCGLPTPQPIFTFPPNVQPSPLYTMPVTTPAPCSTAACSTVVYPGVTPWPVTTPPPTTITPFPGLTPAPCSTATCSTVVYPGVTPWPVTTAPPIVQPSPLYTMPVHDAAPVQPSPLYTMPVTTPAPIASCHAPSPAPANLTAIGYNANGCDGPIICTHTAQVNWTTSTTKVLVSLSAGKIIYVCSVSMSAEGSAVGAALLEAGTKTTNDCDTGTTVGPAIIFGSGTSGTVSNLALGTGVGTVYRSAVSASLCASNTGTSAIVEIQVMYEQFFHALTPDQIEEFCSVPKRCAIFGLYQKLNRIMDRATTPF